MHGTAHGWDGRPRDAVTLPADQRTYVISDLHIGDGTPSDAFFGKDRQLLAFLALVEREDAVLVVNGDVIDLQQAWNFKRVLAAHRELLAAMSRLGREGRLVYVVGNHDHDLGLFREVLSFKVCDEVRLGEAVLVRHGHQYDPYISEMIEHGQWHTVVHHALERWLGTWLRLPLGEFYTVPNRLIFWLTHKVVLAARGAQEAGRRLGAPTPLSDEILANIDFWCWSNMGDSMGIFRPALQDVLTSSWEVLVCGHSHLPGVVRRDGKVYANTGSWTFASSQYVLWDGHDVRCADWLTGRAYGDELYRPMLDGTLYERDFFQWWRENYLGWFRFREGEERRGSLRHWELLLRDHQQLSQLRDVPAPPAPARLRLVHEQDAPPPQPRRERTSR